MRLYYVHVPAVCEIAFLLTDFLAFSGLRAYTVSGSNKIITSLVVILAAVPPVVTTIVCSVLH